MRTAAEWKKDDWAQVSTAYTAFVENEPEYDATLDALTRRYRGRGFARAAQAHLENMDAMEQEARESAPAHYRWDELCINGRGAEFRHASYLGRQVMDVDDFANYFARCRADRQAREGQAVAAEQEQHAYVGARTREESQIARMTGASCIPAREKESRADRLIAVARDWLQPDCRPLRHAASLRRVPISLISLLVVLTVSLMLIVSSSVMVANAKRDVSNLGDEVTLLEREAKLSQDKLSSDINYLEIYRTATEEYGMIPASYVNSVYVNQESESYIEVAQQEEEFVGLGTLLAAIGIHIGS